MSAPSEIKRYCKLPFDQCESTYKQRMLRNAHYLEHVLLYSSVTSFFFVLTTNENMFVEDILLLQAYNDLFLPPLFPITFNHPACTTVFKAQVVKITCCSLVVVYYVPISVFTFSRCYFIAVVSTSSFSRSFTEQVFCVVWLENFSSSITSPSQDGFTFYN